MDSEKSKTAKKEVSGKRKNIVLVIIALAIFIGLGFAYYNYWMSSGYLKTDNAKITAKIYNITPSASGKLVKYTVDAGSYVRENQIIGRVERGGYIRSPIDGLIVKSNATLNQMVSPTAPVAVVADVDNIYVNVNIEETDIVKIAEGQEAFVTIDAYPRMEFHAYVAEIESITQSALTGNQTSFTTSGTYTKVTQLIPVKIVIDDYIDLESLIGVNATVKIKIR